MNSNILLPTQIFISTSILAFAMYMLYIGKDPGIYLPIITAISGSWLPSPLQHKKDGISSSTTRELLRTFTRAPNRMSIDNDIEQPLIPSNTRLSTPNNRDPFRNFGRTIRISEPQLDLAIPSLSPGQPI